MTGILEHLLSTPPWLALLIVFALPALEASAFVGFVIPGETALLLGGVLASHGQLPVAAVAAAGVIGATLGDSIGFAIGRRWGRRVLDSTLGRFVKESHLRSAEQALRERGTAAVFLGRFTVALRVMIPGLAGMARMPYPRFALANIAGAVLWGTAMVAIGFLAGHSWQVAAHYVSTTGAVLLVLMLGGLYLGYRLRRRRTEEAPAGGSA